MEAQYGSAGNLVHIFTYATLLVFGAVTLTLSARPTVLRRDGSGLGTTRGWVIARRAQNDPKAAACHRI
jgi:hypothetical protein